MPSNLFMDLSIAGGGNEFLPCTQCFLKHRDLIGLHIAGDATMALSCFAIPFILLVMLRRSPALARLRGTMALFAVFILLCGIGLVLDIVTLWQPLYYLQAWEKVLTGAVSVAAAVALIPQLPRIARMRSPELLEAANERLATEVRARKMVELDLNRSLTDLRAAVQELEQFAYVTSHDLQAPLRSIAGFSQLLVKRYGDRLDGDALEFLGYIEQGTHQMQGLIQGLLLLSRVGRAELHFEERPLAVTVERAQQGLHEVIEKTGARVEYANLPALVADHDLLTQLLHQLIGNALKFQRPGAQPVVLIEARRDGGDWLLSVSDNGIGIAPDQLQNIFVVFRRLHGANDYEGTGIGLTICRKIAAHHGGSIWATSDASGSQFHLRLPLQPMKQPLLDVARVVADVD